MASDPHRSLLVRGVVGGVVVGLVSLSIAAVAILLLGPVAYVVAGVVGFIGAMVASGVGLGPEYATVWQFYLSNWPLVVPALGALLLPVVYLRPVRDEIQTFRSALGASGLPANIQHPELEGVVEQLAQRADIATPAVHVSKRERPESYALGDGADGTIIVTEGLLEVLGDHEVEGVLAHQVATLENGGSRITNRLVVPMLVAEHIGEDQRPTLRGWLQDDAEVSRQTSAVTAANSSPGASSGLMPFVIYPLHLVGWALLATVTRVQFSACRLGVTYCSRGRVLAADEVAAELTRSPTALASALEKLEDARTHSTDERREFRGTAAALDILPSETQDDDPASLRTHPPTGRRVERLNDLAGEV